jgi:hypothetical protein
MPALALAALWSSHFLLSSYANLDHDPCDGAVNTVKASVPFVNPEVLPRAVSVNCLGEFTGLAGPTIVTGNAPVDGSILQIGGEPD